MSTIGTIKHPTQLTGTNNPAYQASKDWANASWEVASAAADGSVMVRDSTQPDGWGLTPVLPAANGGQGAHNVQAYGAIGNTRKVTDAVTTNLSQTVTSATAGFTAADVGKIVFGVETSTGLLRVPRGTITAVGSATSVTVSVAATATLTGISLVFGTDDTTALLAAFTAAKAAIPKGEVVLPSGGYLFTKCLFDLANTVQGPCISVRGAGSSNTVLYMDPSFDVSTTTANFGAVWKNTSGGNALRFSARGFTLDGSLYAFSGLTARNVVDFYAFKSFYEDIKVVNFRGFQAGAYVYGDGSVAIHCHFEAMHCNAVAVGSGFTFIDCYAGNCINAYSVDLYAVDGSTYTIGNVLFVGCQIDESALGAVQLRNNSNTAVFDGCTVFGPSAAYALKIDGTSVVRAYGSRFIPFSTGGNRGGVNILAGGVLHLSQCIVDKSGTGIGLNNAGTVYDNGGNIINGAAGTVPVGGKFGTHTALAAETVTGYITIHDSAGTPRKLAVVS